MTGAVHLAWWARCVVIVLCITQGKPQPDGTIAVRFWEYQHGLFLTDKLQQIPRLTLQELAHFLKRIETDAPHPPRLDQRNILLRDAYILSQFF